MRYFFAVLLLWPFWPLCNCVADSVMVPSDVPTLEDAILLAQAGDTVWLEPGTYSGAGFTDMYLTGGTGGGHIEVTIISQAGPLYTAIDAGGTPFIQWCDLTGGDMDFIGITVRNASPAFFLCPSSRSHLDVYASQFIDNGVAIKDQGYGSLRVSDCKFAENDTAMALIGYKEWAVDIGWSQFKNNGVGVLMDGTSWMDIYENTFVGNDTAVVLGGTGLYFENNVICRNSHGVVAPNPQGTHINCNDVYGNLDADYTGVPDQTGVAGNISVDPMFCDPTIELGIAVADVSPLLDAPDCGLIGGVNSGCTCCTSGTVGNIDFDIDHLVTMGDLTVLIDHLFISLSPIFCPDAANLDGDPLVTMEDLTVLIDHLFITLAPLPPCP